MVIDFNSVPYVSEIERRGIAKDVNDSGSTGIIVTINAAVLPRISRMTYDKAFNYDDGSEVTNGLIRVRLNSDWWIVGGPRGFSMHVKYKTKEQLTGTEPERGYFSFDPEEPLSEFSTNGPEFRTDSTTIEVDSERMKLLLLASDYNGRKPAKLKFRNGEGAAVTVKDIAYVNDGNFIPVKLSDSGKPTLAFNSKTCTRSVVNVDLGPSVADEDFISCVNPQSRYTITRNWSNNYREFVYSRTLNLYIPSKNANAVIVGLPESGDFDEIDVDFLERGSEPRTIDVFHRRNDDLSNTRILFSVADYWCGREWAFGMVPVIKRGVFSFDISTSTITFRLDYHQAPRVEAEPFSSGFTIGFEVEKEDYVKLRESCAEELYDETRWAKERDGSLDGDSGYGLVSPTYDLMSDKIDKDIASNATLSNLINGDYSRSCGGHIHLGSQWSGNTFFDKLSPWIPLIYSLYVGRVGADYCKVKKNEAIKSSSEKYQAIRIFDDRVEFRIISAVKNVETLLWRRDLMRIIVQNLEYTPMKIVGELLDDKSALYAHLRKQYTPSQIAVKAKLYAYFASELLDDAHAVKQHVMNAVDHFSKTQLRHLRNYSFNVNKPE